MPSTFRRITVAMTAVSALALLACGGAAAPPRESGPPASQLRRALSRDLASARQVGAGQRFRPGPTSRSVGQAAVVDGMRCGRSHSAVSAAHIEVFAANHVVLVPAGVGVAPILRREGAYVLGGRCVYPMRTYEPTGLVLLGAGPPRTLGEFFDLWGQPLDRHSVAGFQGGPPGGVAVFVGGVPWRGDPRSVPVAPASQITIEVGPHVPPHDRYLFPPPPALGR